MTDLKVIAHLYFSSWIARDFVTFCSLLAEDATFSGPFGSSMNADNLVEGIKNLSKIVTDIVIQKMWVDGADVITWFELYTNKSDEPLNVVNWSHIENNQITAIRVVFDPRVLMG